MNQLRTAISKDLMLQWFVYILLLSYVTSFSIHSIEQKCHKTTLMHSSTNHDDLQTSTIPVTKDEIFDATTTLTKYDNAQAAYCKQRSEKISMGTASLLFLRDEIQKEDELEMRNAIMTLARAAEIERSKDSSQGRVMLGICAENVSEALAGLKLWVGTLGLPRGLLHGLDVDGVPLNLEGAIYIKYSTGGAMTFSEMRRSGRGFDALWKPGDALLELYDGDYRGIYFSLELPDGEFRQFGVLPTDLFLEDDDEDW